MEKAIRKPRTTKAVIHDFCRYYLNNVERLSKCNSARIQQIYKEEKNVELSALTIRNNINKYVLIDNELVPVQFAHLKNHDKNKEST